MLKFLLTGAVLGFSAGISPGPLLALIISETIRHHAFSGIKVAFAPLITDAPIVTLCFLVLNQVSNIPAILGVISILGGLYVAWLGIDNLRVKEINLTARTVSSRSLWKGVVTNALSPHPYLFWLSVGSPLMVRALEMSEITLVLFLAGFYFCLIGAKVAIAILVGQSKRILSNYVFKIVNHIMGIILMLFAGLLIRDGIRYLSSIMLMLEESNRFMGNPFYAVYISWI